MASEAVTEPETTTATEDMDLENPQPGPKDDASGDAPAKREREEADEAEVNGGDAKKQKVEEEKSVEEARMEKLEGEGEGEGEGEEKPEPEGPVVIGPKTFGSSVEMFDYFYKLLHHWPTNININKYEQLVLQELINKGHPEPAKKIGSGINAFEIRQHPEWKSRCFFVIRADESVEDFSFRKCVDHIRPLPENMKIKSDVNKALGGGKGSGGGGRGGGRGRGRGRGGGGRGGGKFRR